LIPLLVADLWLGVLLLRGLLTLGVGLLLLAGILLGLVLAAGRAGAARGAATLATWRCLLLSGLLGGAGAGRRVSRRGGLRCRRDFR